jgi:hypothetical protein
MSSLLASGLGLVTKNLFRDMKYYKLILKKRKAALLVLMLSNRSKLLCLINLEFVFLIHLAEFCSDMTS